MTRKELAAVEKMVRNIYSTWHMCRLSRKEAEQMKLKPGRLCDTCEAFVSAHMKDLP